MTNEDKTKNAEKRCIKWCEKHHLILVTWKGSKGKSTFKCKNCGQTRLDYFTNILLNNNLKVVCYKCRVEKSLKEFYKKDAEILKINLTKGYALLKCKHCGIEFKVYVSKYARSSTYKKCKCLHINNRRRIEKNKEIENFCKESGVKLIKHLNNSISVWRFPCGHMVKRRWDNIKQGHLTCPECDAASIVESKLRIWLNKHTKYNWYQERPIWLKNPKTNKSLEIDIYCPKLKIGIEYNGSQHYIVQSRFTKEELKERKKLDRIKIKQCKKKGVILLVINGMDYPDFKYAKKFMLNKLHLTKNGNIYELDKAQLKLIKKGLVEKY